MRATRNEIEAPIVFFNALDLPASGAFVRNHGINGKAFDFIISNQICDIWSCSFRVGQNPS